MKINPIAILSAAVVATGGYALYQVNTPNVVNAEPVEEEINSHYVPRDIGYDVRTVTSTDAKEFTFLRKNVGCELVERTFTWADQQMSSKDFPAGKTVWYINCKASGTVTDLAGKIEHYSDQTTCGRYEDEIGSTVVIKNWTKPNSVPCAVAREFNIY